MYRNIVVASGNLTGDMEKRVTQSGMDVGTFGLAITERRKDRNGEWSEKTNFVDCTMFGPRVSKIQPLMTQGTKVCVEAKLDYQEWSKDGRKNRKVGLIVDNVEIMSEKPRQSPQDVVQQAYPQASIYADEDIPF